MITTAPHALEHTLVLDLLNGPISEAARNLADLGATVTRIEPIQCADPELDPVEAAQRHARKARERLDPNDAEDRNKLRALLGKADLVMLDCSPHAPFPLDPQELRRDYPDLAIIAVSDFGQTAAFRDWKVSETVLQALSGNLATSGLEGREPLLPPEGIAYGAATSQIAMLAGVALVDRIINGRGSSLDISVLEAMSQALDPAFGIAGSAATGAAKSQKTSRARPPRGVFYPILPCKDGHVRICILAKRQWQGMFKWMGSPEEFADPRFNDLHVRFGTPEVNTAIATFFSEHSREDLEKQGTAHGVPVGAMLTLDEAIQSEHMKSRCVIQNTDSDPADAMPLVTNCIRIADTPPLAGAAEPSQPTRTPEGSGPLSGLRVLDLGVIVVGAETSRLLSDLGADVIKVESKSFPDGIRAASGNPMTQSFAVGHRGKRSLGLNLRDPEGRDLFLQLAATADIVLSNFKPGTMEKLGLDQVALNAVNPRLISIESSAFGDTGPWSARMGYGPLVRASAGLTDLWRYPDDPDSFSDAVTVYPDHTASRYGVLAAVALLVRRLRTRQGGKATISQAEVMFSHLATRIARLARNDGPAAVKGVDGVFPVQGNDEWCAVTAQTQTEIHTLTEILLLPKTAAKDPDRLESALRNWLRELTGEEAMETLQTAGIAAGRMLRQNELTAWRARWGHAQSLEVRHPLLPETYNQDGPMAVTTDWPAPPDTPAPKMGENTFEVLREWLNLSDEELANFHARDILELASPLSETLEEKEPTS